MGISAYLPSVIRFQNSSKKRKRDTEILKGKVVNHWWYFSIKQSMINVIVMTFLEIEIDYINKLQCILSKSQSSSSHFRSLQVTLGHEALQVPLRSKNG